MLNHDGLKSLKRIYKLIARNAVNDGEQTEHMRMAKQAFGCLEAYIADPEGKAGLLTPEVCRAVTFLFNRAAHVYRFKPTSKYMTAARQAIAEIHPVATQNPAADPPKPANPTIMVIGGRAVPLT